MIEGALSAFLLRALIMSITKILDEFLASDDRVAVIKGEWGVGKHIFGIVTTKVKRNKREIDQIAYSYVSLFGLNSIGEIKKNYSLPQYQQSKTL
ncbi:hypothetical protein RBI80_29180 (plasmid) [Klebsiella variicola]|nr:hypothetical protein RBI80_29180 [Klebsiella variicola]